MKLANLFKKTIGIMVASGFDEFEFIAIQRAMMNSEAKLKIISREAGLTNAWNGNGWGMSYPVDATLSSALAIDYDGLIIPSGKLHVDNLINEPHAKRVLGAFLREDMPVLLQGDAVELLQSIDISKDRRRSRDDDAYNTLFVNRRLVTVESSEVGILGLQAFDSVLATGIDDSCAA